jgi:hypothetical protein
MSDDVVPEPRLSDSPFDSVEVPAVVTFLNPTNRQTALRPPTGVREKHRQ